MADRQPCHERESHAQSIRSTGVKRETRRARSIHDSQLVSKREDFQVQRNP
jgi:hypothetical protein